MVFAVFSFDFILGKIKKLYKISKNNIKTL